MQFFNTLLINIKNTLPLFILLFSSMTYAANDRVKTIAKVKPAIVGVGTFNPLSSPQLRLLGTGFAILDGLHIVTNKHVIPVLLEQNSQERIVVFIGSGLKPEYRSAKVMVSSRAHDLVILKISGAALPTFKLSSNRLIGEGSEVLFTGFPIGAVLGLYPVTHRGMISSQTPIAIPVPSAKYLDIANLKRLKAPYIVYQLDATAYPGNSGSPMYSPLTGEIYGILNKVFVKETKESVLERPSGISYAIPVKYLNQLIDRLPN